MSIRQGETNGRWLELCEQAAVEQDPAKLLELVQKINEMAVERRRSLEQGTPVTASDRAFPRTKSANSRILLVDDSATVRGLIKTLLAQQNPAWEIAEAGNGQDALEKALTLQPDLVLLDLNLPDISGLDAVLKIRQLSPATKIIICSFSDTGHIAAMAQHVGADGHFTKTSSPEDLHQTIAAVLDHR